MQRTHPQHKALYVWLKFAVQKHEHGFFDVARSGTVGLYHSCTVLVPRKRRERLHLT
jgi:hypothetical protein